MSHQVLSRKYRPQGFDELVGQGHVGQILRNAILGNRVGHAYLFVGPRGVGKTTTARIFARALNCSSGGGDEPVPDPCGTCASCVDITVGSDLDVVEMDAASNNHVEDVRRLREQVGYATVRSRYRIWIVDEVHMLSMPAFNAFLKTLEEPPERVKFIFCTTEEHKLPDTFRSRCQRIEFRPIEASAMAARLEDLAAREGIAVEAGLCDEIAAAALGGLRDAESMLEQLIAACPDASVGRADLDALSGRASGDLLDRLGEAIAAQDAAGALDAVDAALATGCKPGVLIEQWMERLRRELVEAARAPTSGADGAERPPSVARVARSLDVLLQKRIHLRAGADGTLVCQVAAVELARLPDARDLDRLIAALETPAREPAPTPQPGSGARREPPAAPARPSAPNPASASRAPDAPRSPAPEPAPPAPEPASPGVSPERDRAPPSAGPLPPASSAPDVRTAWPALLAAAEAENGRLAEALSRVRPGEAHDGLLEVHVGAGDVMARSTLERREAVLVFRRITQAVLGVPLAPRVRVEQPTAPESAPEPPPEEHPAVRLVREQTGGRLLNLETDPPVPPSS